MKVWYIDRGDGEARRTQVTGDMGKVMEHYPEIVSACGEARRVPALIKELEDTDGNP